MYTHRVIRCRLPFTDWLRAQSGRLTESIWCKHEKTENSLENPLENTVTMHAEFHSENSWAQKNVPNLMSNLMSNHSYNADQSSFLESGTCALYFLQLCNLATLQPCNLEKLFSYPTHFLFLQPATLQPCNLQPCNLEFYCSNNNIVSTRGG